MKEVIADGITYEGYTDTFLKPESSFLPPVRMGIQSRGEMAAGAVTYLQSLGWDTAALTENSRVLVTNTGRLTVFKLRTPTIVEALRQKTLDMAILGADIIAENDLSSNPVPLVPIKSLEFGDCKFCLGFPLERTAGFPLSRDKLPELLGNTVIATSLPNILKEVMRRERISINEDKLITMDGSCETAVKLWKATAVADRVSTGETMFANNLRPEFTLAYFPGAFLVGRKDFLFRLKGGD